MRATVAALALLVSAGAARSASADDTPPPPSTHAAGPGPRAWGQAIEPLATAMRLRSPSYEPPGAGDESDPFWGPDKALHFGGGFVISLFGYGIGRSIFDDDQAAAVAFGAGCSLAAAAGKEALDAAGLGTPSWKDFAWTVFGAALGLGTSVVFDAALAE